MQSPPALPPRRWLPAALLACAASLAAPAGAQDTVADFAAGPPNGAYAFASSTPRPSASCCVPAPRRPSR